MKLFHSVPELMQSDSEWKKKQQVRPVIEYRSTVNMADLYMI